MARGKKAQMKNKKLSSKKKSGKKSSDRRVSFRQTNIESKSESDSQMSTNDSAEPEKIVKKSAGRPRKDSTNVSPSIEKKSVGRPKNRNRSESSVLKSKENQSKGSSEGEQSKQLDSAGGESSEDEDNYEVEEIIDFKIEDDIKYFLIRWKGYDSSVDSWEKRRSLNCPELIAKFYEEHPEARTSNTKRKRNYDSDYEVSSSDSNCDLATIKTSSNPAIRNGKNSTRVRQYSTSDEESESESEVDTTDSEPKVAVKKSVGRPKSSAVVKVSSSTEKKVVGRPRKHDQSEDEEQYEVEDIIDFGIEDNIKYFLVRWKGYDSSGDSWEKQRSLNCPELIAEFYKKHPEARVGTTNYKKTKMHHSVDGSYSGSGSNSDSGSGGNDDSDYGPTYYEQLTMRPIGYVKKSGKKSISKRTTGRQTSVRSSYKTNVDNTSDEESESESELEVDTEDPEAVVEEKKSVGRPRKHAVANISPPPKKRSAGRPKKNVNNEVSKDSVDDRSKVDNKEGSLQEEQEEDVQSGSDTNKSNEIENSILS